MQHTFVLSTGDEDAFIDGSEAGFHVVPKVDCEHLRSCLPEPIPAAASAVDCKEPHCNRCDAGGEVWVCLTCYHVGCSRYVAGHGAAHAGEGQEEVDPSSAAAGAGGSMAAGAGGGAGRARHLLALSMADMSVWCYGCQSYLDVFQIPALHEPFRRLHVARFGEEPALPTGGHGASPVAPGGR